MDKVMTTATTRETRVVSPSNVTYKSKPARGAVTKVQPKAPTKR